MAGSTDDRLPADLDVFRSTTREVGDEGGGLGDVEVETDRGPGVGSEADETWRPAEERRGNDRRDP